MLVLASGSPRRRELLTELGVTFEVMTSDVPEIPQSGEFAETFARRVARDKALAVARRCPGRHVLAADTVVVLGAAILNKPVDRADARRMLHALSGRAHRVLTAVALVDPLTGLDELIAESTVELRPLTSIEIETYLDSGESFDKAGAYAVQGLAKAFVISVSGSLSNVIGLPLENVADLLRRHLPAHAVAPA